jgi:PPK2 family polyphosphate:nucleotide phosphotransferase
VNDVEGVVRVAPGEMVDLDAIDPAQTGPFERKRDGVRVAQRDLEELRAAQEKLYVDKRHALLLVLQGMDTAGKDGMIRHLSGGIDLLGAQVTAFRPPSEEEQRHDFLWRVHQRVPPRGVLGVFNRSHYEDVLVPVVHKVIDEETRHARYAQINAFERILDENAVTIVKCFLHISKAEQKERLQARLDNSAKQWKFDPGDLRDRELWSQYQHAYAELLARCSTAEAPWYIVPADHKWFRNWAVVRLLIETLNGLDLEPPRPDFDPQKIAIS